jgi:hypothetical protein
MVVFESFVDIITDRPQSRLGSAGDKSGIYIVV